MNRLLLVVWAAAIAVSALVTVGAVRAGVGHGHDGCCEARCPSCDKTCRPESITTKEKKTTWDVECEDICIPAITFPWQKCCGPRCGKVITVNRLKKIEYECESCGCKWNIESLPCNSGGNCDCGHAHYGCLGDSGYGNPGSEVIGLGKPDWEKVGLPESSTASPGRTDSATRARRGSRSAEFLNLGPPLPSRTSTSPSAR